MATLRAEINATTWTELENAGAAGSIYHEGGSKVILTEAIAPPADINTPSDLAVVPKALILQQRENTEYSAVTDKLYAITVNGVAALSYSPAS